MEQCGKDPQVPGDYQDRRQSPSILEHDRSFLVKKTGAQIERTLSGTRYKRDYLLAIKAHKHNHPHYHPPKLAQEVP